MTQQVFVYGTLKRGGWLHGYVEHHKYMGTDMTVLPEFSLINFGAYPGVITSGIGRIKGEVYEVPDALINTLDAVEGTPDLFRREKIALEKLGEAWMYIYNMSAPPKIDPKTVTWPITSHNYLDDPVFEWSPRLDME